MLDPSAHDRQDRGDALGRGTGTVGRILSFRNVRASSPDAAAGRASPPGSGRRPDDSAPALSAAEAQRFRALVLPHLDAAYGFARFLSRDATLAEDIVQDAFLKAYRGFAGFRGGDPRAWLFAIVRTTFLSTTRGRTTWADPEATEAIPSEADTPEAALLRQGEAASVRGAIEALPEPFREALVLRELEELSYRQIAEVTSAPIGTVMSRLARARQMLLAALREEGEP
ncbi:MAG: sigma-70 family RNA polymerase sigma factor [Phenylobacterium sp.]|nr:MAG: sigma-70 family RNA polymerase sigma factor [Phenylobacterium sp.]